jgi:lipopolysaccharide biosynthesis glycosyltransferase
MLDVLPRSALVFAADEGYALPTAVALHSALRHLAPATRVQTCVLDNGLAGGSRDRLQRVARAAGGHDIEWLEIPPGLLVQRSMANHTATTYARLLLQDLLPADVDRVVYLDGDVLVREDLSPLFQVDLGTASFAATRDFASPRSDDASGRSDDPVEARPFFNPGVLVVDLARWRTDGFPQRALAFARDSEEPLPFVDQDAMNAVAGPGEWFDLDLRWNVQVALMYRPDLPRTQLTEFLYANREAIYRDAAIVHFNAIPKPWQPWSYGTARGKAPWAAELVRSRWFSPAESVRWAAPWLGKLLIDATRRTKFRPSSAQ